MSIGPFSQKELVEKLKHVPKEEIEQYNEQRMKTYRKYTRIAFLFGILAAGLFFVLPWLTLAFAIIGFVVISITSYNRFRWRNLYENFTYYKQQATKKQRKRKELLENK